MADAFRRYFPPTVSCKPDQRQRAKISDHSGPSGTSLPSSGSSAGQIPTLMRKPSKRSDQRSSGQSQSSSRQFCIQLSRRAWKHWSSPDRHGWRQRRRHTFPSMMGTCRLMAWPHFGPALAMGTLLLVLDLIGTFVFAPLLRLAQRQRCRLSRAPTRACSLQAPVRSGATPLVYTSPSLMETYVAYAAASQAWAATINVSTPVSESRMDDRREVRAVISRKSTDPAVLLRLRVRVRIRSADKPEDGRNVPFGSERSEVLARRRRPGFAAHGRQGNTRKASTTRSLASRSFTSVDSGPAA